MPYRLIYASSATHELSREELAAILAVARRNNARAGISGMLLYRNGNFIQLLEGPEEAVRKLFAAIEADPRHGSVTVLDERVVGRAALADWSMGYREAEEGDEAGLFDLTRNAIDRQLADTPRAIVRFMQNFYAINRD